MADCCTCRDVKSGRVEQSGYRRGKDVLCRDSRNHCFPVISAGALNLFAAGKPGIRHGQAVSCLRQHRKKYGYSTQGEHRMALMVSVENFIVRGESDCRQDELAAN